MKWKQPLMHINMELYYPRKINQLHLVGIPHGGTLLSPEINDKLLSEMQSVAGEEYTEEQIDNLVEKIDKPMLPWELYNKLIGYVCPHQMESFRALFDSQIKKEYRTVEEAMEFLINA